MISFSTFPNRYAKKPKLQSFALDTFVQGMTAPVSTNTIIKDDLPLWSPTVFQGNRCQSNAQYISCLVFDVDDGETSFDTWKLFHIWDVIAHTSFSHSDEHAKYRIILPLEKPIPVCDWNKAWRRAIDIWVFVGCQGMPDMKALKDPARMYYRYALPKNKSGIHQAVSEKGFHRLKLDYSKIELPKPKQVKQRPHNTTMTVSEAIMDTRLRDAIANRAGGVIAGNRAHHITCPRCSQSSAYFFIDIEFHGNPMKGWQCNHKNSCGGFGNLAELI
jgi:hypothetical protein